MTVWEPRFPHIWIYNNRIITAWNEGYSPAADSFKGYCLLRGGVPSLKDLVSTPISIETKPLFGASIVFISDKLFIVFIANSLGNFKKGGQLQIYTFPKMERLVTVKNIHFSGDSHYDTFMGKIFFAQSLGNEDESKDILIFDTKQLKLIKKIHTQLERIIFLKILHNASILVLGGNYPYEIYSMLMSFRFLRANNLKVFSQKCA